MITKVLMATARGKDQVKLSHTPDDHRLINLNQNLKFEAATNNLII